MEDKAKSMRVLDLFCGAAWGLSQAGFEEIVGIDIAPQPRYPFKFIQADAMTYPLGEFDFVWASPPCQHYTQMLNHGLTPRDKHPDLIEGVRQRLLKIPHVIENVAGSPPLLNAGMLCGEMFELRVTRHRFFECSFPISWPKHKPHRGHGHRKQGDGGYYYRVYGHETGKAKWGEAMGIHWMKSPELAQAIPPAYSQYIGGQFLCKKY